MKQLLFVLTVLTLFSCDSGPKVIEAEPATAEHPHTPDQQANQGTAAGMPQMQNGQTEAEHRVVAAETLQTERYTYVKVKENNEEFWVAIPKSDIKIGDAYTYRGGLMKKDFFSKEHNRTFETLYLVSNLFPVNQVASTGVPQPNTSSNTSLDLSPPKSVTRAPGAISISELVKNKTKYNGKPVKITGKVMKVNQMIMNRNWLHVQDGSGGQYDLTVTSTESIPPGHIVTLEGTVTLDKDFGAGYRYEILLENATLVK